MKPVDVCVRGAGAVGSCLALALARQGLKVALQGSAVKPAGAVSIEAGRTLDWNEYGGAAAASGAGAVAGTVYINETAGETLVPLSGETYLSVYSREMGADGVNRVVSVYTQKVSLDGLVLRVDTEYLTTGTQVRIAIAEAPGDWTEDMKTSFLYMTWPNTDGAITSCGVSAKLMIDGADAGDLPLPDRWSEGELLYLLPLFQGGENAVSSAALQLNYSYYVTLNDTDQLAGESLAIPEDGLEFRGATQTVPLTNIPIPLP